MNEEVTIHVDESHTDRTYRVTASVAAAMFQHYKAPLLDSVIEHLRDHIVDQWMDLYGSELMEELSPGLLKTLVANSIAKKVLG